MREGHRVFIICFVVACVSIVIMVVTATLNRRPLTTEQAFIETCSWGENSRLECARMALNLTTLPNTQTEQERP